MNEFIIQWYSRSIFNFQPSEIKQLFRKIETKSKQLITNNLHQEFNYIICLKENLLPIYTNVYIYIYIKHVLLNFRWVFNLIIFSWSLSASRNAFLSSGDDVRRMQNDSHFVNIFTVIKLSDVTSPSIVKSTMSIIGSWTLYKTLHYNKDTKVYKLIKRQGGKNRVLKTLKNGYLSAFSAHHHLNLKKHFEKLKGSKKK